MSVGSLLKSAARALGYDLVNARRFWGACPWSDIRRLTTPEEINTIFDVGANIGQTAVLLAGHFALAKIYAFEPVESTFRELTEATSKYPKISCFQLGMGSASATTTINLFGDSRVSSIRDDAPYVKQFLDSDNARKETIRLSTVDEFCDDHDVESVDVLKIDTEGFDIEVLKGAKSLLQEGRIRFVLTEFNSFGEGDGGLQTVISALSDHQYELLTTYTDSLRFTPDLFAVRNAMFCHQRRLPQH